VIVFTSLQGISLATRDLHDAMELGAQSPNRRNLLQFEFVDDPGVGATQSGVAQRAGGAGEGESSEYIISKQVSCMQPWQSVHNLACRVRSVVC
jgi:hypothetical protein